MRQRFERLSSFFKKPSTDMAGSEITIHYQATDQTGDFHSNSHVSEVLAEDEKPAQAQDVEKTLLEAEQFLTNFAGLREENDHLKQQIQEYEAQLENLTAELQQCQLEKQNLEQALLQEREQHKEQLWALRSELQKAQEERLSWKEKYLDACMKSGSQPNNNLDNTTSPSSSPRAQEQSSPSPKKLIGPAGKRKRGHETIASATGEEYYANLESFGLADGQEEQPVVMVIHKRKIGAATGVQKTSSTDVKVNEAGQDHDYLCSLLLSKQADPSMHDEDEEDEFYGFRCVHCAMTFNKMSHLHVHVGTQHQERPFKCDQCERAYSKKVNLSRHRASHSARNIHHCPTCHKQFTRRDMMMKHIARVHRNELAEACPFCTKRFKDKSSLNRHVNGIHNDISRYVCGDCGFQSKWKSTYVKHVLVHKK